MADQQSDPISDSPDTPDIRERLAGVASRALDAVETAAGNLGMGQPVEARAAVTINRTPADVYAYWRDLERLPTFMAHLDSVTARPDGTSHWVARGPGGGHVEWDATLVTDEPERRLSWASVPGSGVDNAGSVEFRPAPGDRGTEVRVQLQFRAPLGALGSTVARLFGEHPQQQVADDLRRFKQILETGEVLRSDATPQGTRSIDLARQRSAVPTEA